MKIFFSGVFLAAISFITPFSYLPAIASGDSYDIESFKPIIKQVDLLSFLGKPVKIPVSKDKDESIYVYPPQFVFNEDTGQVYSTPLQSIFLASGQNISKAKKELVQVGAEKVLDEFIFNKGPLVEEIRKTLLAQLNSEDRNKDALNNPFPLLYKEANAAASPSINSSDGLNKASRKALAQIYNSNDSRATGALNWLTVNLAYNGVLGSVPQSISEKMNLNPDAASASVKRTTTEPVPASETATNNLDNDPQLQPYGERSILERVGRAFLGDTQYETLFGNNSSPTQTEVPKETQAPSVSPSASPAPTQPSSQQEPYEPPQDQPIGSESKTRTYTRSDGTTGTEVATLYDSGNGRIEIVTERDDNTKDIYISQKSPDGSEFRKSTTQYPDGTERTTTTEVNPEKYSRRTYSDDSIEYKDPNFRTMSQEEGQKIWERKTSSAKDISPVSSGSTPNEEIEPIWDNGQPTGTGKQNNWRNLTDYEGAKNFFESQGSQVTDGGEGVGITVTDKNGNQSTYPDTQSLIEGANTTPPEYNGGVDLFQSASNPGSSIQAINDVKLPTQQSPSNSQTANTLGDRSEDYVAPPDKPKGYQPIDPYGSEERDTRSVDELIRSGAIKNSDGSYTDPSTGETFSSDDNGFFTGSSFSSSSIRDLVEEAESKTPDKPNNWSGSTQATGKIPTTKGKSSTGNKTPDTKTETPVSQLPKDDSQGEGATDSSSSSSTLPPVPSENSTGTKTPTSGEEGSDQQTPPETYENLGKDGNFDQLAECMGFKKGEIPKNGALIGFYTDKSHTRMNVWYLDPRSGKAIGSNGDTTGQQPLVTYPQGIGNKYGLGENGIYAIQVQPHYSDNADTVESPLTARSDVKMTSSGTNPKDNPRINLHPGTSTDGCLGLGDRKQSDGFMQPLWDNVRGSAKPSDYNDDCSQKKGGCYNKHRARDTVLLATMDAGTCQGDPYQAIRTLQAKNGYNNYDPKIINF